MATLNVNCLSCKKLISTNPEDSWKSHCDECYAKEVRQCTKCGGNISLKAKKWTKTCLTCFLEERKKTHKPCPHPNHPESTRERLTCRKNMPACKMCVLNELASSESASDTEIVSESDKENEDPKTPPSAPVPAKRQRAPAKSKQQTQLLPLEEAMKDTKKKKAKK